MKSFFGIFLFVLCVLSESFAQDNKPRYAQLKPIEISSLSSATNSTNESIGKLVMSKGDGTVVWKSLSDFIVGYGVLPVTNGGTGGSTAAAYSVFGNSSSSVVSPSYTTDPVVKTLGVAGSNVITIKPQATTGTYNFNLPISAGTLGQPLLSGGGGTTAMTFGTLGVGGGGTGLSSYTTGDLLYASATGTLAALPAVATGYVLSSNGTGVAPSWKTFDSAIGSSILPVANGGTGKSSVTSKALLLGNGTNALTEITKPTIASTQVLVASSTLDPSWGATVAMSGDVSIDNNGITTVSGISGKSISGTLSKGYILKYNETNWVPSDPTSFYTFSNGLTSSAGTVKLGGTLTEATTITLGDNDILFNPSNTTGKGNFIIHNGNTGAFIVYSSAGGGKFQISADGRAYLANSMTIDLGLSIASNGTGSLLIGNGSTLNMNIDNNDLFVTDDAVIGGDLRVNGTFSTPSDQRLKTKIQTLGNVLDKINKLRTVSFEFIDQTKYAKGPQIGVIAQELQMEFPELVSQVAGGYLSVDYTHLTAVFIQAVKEQQIQIGNLQNRVEEQQKKLETMQGKIDAILRKIDK